MMATSYARPEFRPQPVATRESTAFWTGGRDGQLLIYRCNACRRFFHPPTPVCWRCRSMDVGPLPVSGRATVASYTVNRQPWLPGFPPPYVVALVELAEERDVRLMTGMGFLHEACLQLWNDAGDRQVRGNPEVAVVGTGGGPVGGAMLLSTR
jgi:uncharacterized OB-fold protein